MKRLAIAAIALLLSAASAWAQSGQIVCPDEVEPNQPIVATLATELPEGAQIQGGWACDTAKYIQVDARTIHIWAAPGTHLLEFRGAWMQTKEVQLPDGQTINALLGFGFLDDHVTITVSGAPDPVPPPIPPTPGTRWAVIVEETASRVPSPLRVQLRQQLDSQRLLIVDKDQQSQSLQKYVQAALASQSTLPVLVVVSESGDVIRAEALPGTVEGVKEVIQK